MSDMNQLVRELNNMILDTRTPIEVHSKQIVDDLMIRYADIFDTNPTAKALGDMVTRIDTSHATEGEDGVWWGEVKRLVQVLAR